MSTQDNRQGLHRIILPLAVWIILLLVPVPDGLQPKAWQFFSLFSGIVIALIVEPLPAAVIGLLGVTLSVVFSLVDPSPEESIKWALGGFSNATVWLIFSAFMFSRGYQNTGLGRRIALLLVRSLGRRTLSLGYAIAFSDLLLAPFMPSNTARSGGTIFPVIRNIPALYDSEPGPSARKIGSYIMWTGLTSTCVTSSMFVTALAPNLLGLDLVRSTLHINISWMMWFTGFLPLGLILIVSVPALVYLLYPPEVKSSDAIPVWAGGELEKLGPMSRQEWLMIGFALLALGLWIFCQHIINASAVALIVICLMIITGVVTWNELLSDKEAWNVFIWFATLVSLAAGLSKTGFTAWLGKVMIPSGSAEQPVLLMIMLLTAFYLSHYLFASTTAHVTALFPVFLSAAAGIGGMNSTVFAMLLLYSLGMVGIISPYGTGPSPIYYGSGFISRRDFWLLGCIFGLLFLALLLCVELPYLLSIDR